MSISPYSYHSVSVVSGLTGRAENRKALPMSNATQSQDVESAPLFGARVTAAAALSICESLMLALNDRNILLEHEIVGVLRDAAAAHSNHPDATEDSAFHVEVASLINRIIRGGNSVRRDDAPSGRT